MRDSQNYFYFPNGGNLGGDLVLQGSTGFRCRLFLSSRQGLRPAAEALSRIGRQTGGIPDFK